MGSSPAARTKPPPVFISKVETLLIYYSDSSTSSSTGYQSSPNVSIYQHIGRCLSLVTSSPFLVGSAVGFSASAVQSPASFPRSPPVLFAFLFGGCVDIPADGHAVCTRQNNNLPENAKPPDFGTEVRRFVYEAG